ncbi:hypothetical protein C5167_050208 [Papaver somniferum]|uniref:Uncharacterized protein n=1 Tax=Papaver somniferum TaxID=3469 RepID=A0A4Y7KRE7_PAPSO|nr:hypothetical protein C5167_050208 [Papaver somniferum]
MKKMKPIVRNYKKKIEFVSEGVVAYKNLSFQCLSEVTSLQFRDFYNMKYMKMYIVFISQLQEVEENGEEHEEQGT